jgi:hypothetical protein
VGADRWQVGAGWFITDNILLKGEYVTQKYNGFAPTDIRSGGMFQRLHGRGHSRLLIHRRRPSRRAGRG